jgi:elongator complex protein 3
MLGATLDNDRQDFSRLWLPADAGWGLNPDEIKIYPTQLLENTVLHGYWQRGEYQPYTTGQLIQLLADIKPYIPTYCRVNRIIRDIPSSHVVEGNRRTSLREDVHQELERRGQACRCIRCREVRKQVVDPDSLQLHDTVYEAAYAEEHFLSFDTPLSGLAGYLRLSLPLPLENVPGRLLSRGWIDFPDLQGAAIIREVHVYGQSLPFGDEKPGAAQHIGLGTALLEKAEQISRQKGFSKLAVISAIGTRQYYARRGFSTGDLYMVKMVY